MDTSSILDPQKHIDHAFAQDPHSQPRNDIPLEGITTQAEPLGPQTYYDPMNSQPIMVYEMQNANLVSFDSLVSVPLSKASQEKLQGQINLPQANVYNHTNEDVSQPLCILSDRCKPSDNEKFLISQIYSSDDPNLVLDTRHYAKVSKYDLEIDEPMATEFDMSSTPYESTASGLTDMNSLAISGVYQSSAVTDSEVALTLASLGNPKHQKLDLNPPPNTEDVDLNSLCLLRGAVNPQPSHPTDGEISLGECNYLSPNTSFKKQEKPTLVLRSRRTRASAPKAQQSDLNLEDPEKIVKKKRKQNRSNMKSVQKNIAQTQKGTQEDFSNKDPSNQPQKENLLGELLKASKHCKPASLIPEGVVDDVIPAVGYRIIDMSNLSEMIRVMHRCGRSQPGSIVIQEQASLREGAVSQLSIICTACQGGTICATSNKRVEDQWDINSRIEQLTQEFNIKEENIQRMLEILGIFYRPSSPKEAPTALQETPATTDVQKKKKKKEKERNFECTVCKMKFIGSNHLKGHMRTHNVANHTCPYCQAYFKKSYNLKEHIKKHENLKYECSHCLRSYSDKSTLIAHINSFHEKKVAFVCEYCLKKFTRKSHYKEHLRVHTGEKPYSCEFCGKKYIWHDSVKKHMMTHYAGSKYKCRLCGKMFRWLLGIQSHLLLQHKVKKCDIKAEVISSVLEPQQEKAADSKLDNTGDTPTLSSRLVVPGGSNGDKTPAKEIQNANLIEAPPNISGNLSTLPPNVADSTHYLSVTGDEGMFTYQ